jgi:type IV secretory pathway VirB4 component
VEWDTRAAKVGDQWTTTLVVTGYPDQPKDGYLSELFELSDVRFDVTARLTPRSQRRARRALKDAADGLQADADLDASARGAYLQERANAAQAAYAAVEDGARVVDQALYVTVRAEDREALQDAVGRVRATMRDAPANLAAAPAICQQDRALRGAAPLRSDPLDRTSVALGGAAGALLASPHSPTVLEDGGVEVGVHRDTGTPVVIDPFGRENGYATFTVGDPGSGKSFGAKQRFLRTMAQDPDRVGVILEPLNDWVGVAEALDATRITVGGDRGLNPLEIQPTPPGVRDRMGEDASPFNEKLDDALAFLANVLAMRGAELGDRRPTLETALVETYAERGITADPATHDRESPTLRDVLDVLESMVNAPGEYVVRVEAERGKLREDATWLLDQLRPFAEGGRYEHLGRPTEFDLSDERVVYLDLAQQEGSVAGESATALTMQLLISLMYERAKAVEEMVFVIDEARYAMSHTPNLAFLETAFRHHRHHDLSIRLVTQTVDEFFERPEAETIVDQCAVRTFHALSGMDEEWASEFELNPAQEQFVRNAVPGNDDAGYSEALVGVDGEWRGIEVRALPQERRVIENMKGGVAGS